MVVNNPANTATFQFSTIDPAPIIDLAGALWTGWGSGFGKDQTKTQLWVTRLGHHWPAPDDGLCVRAASRARHALQPGRKEGSYLHYHGGSYFLFYNEGSCCDGTASNYTFGWRARRASPGPSRVTRSSTPAMGTSTARGTWAFTAHVELNGSPITTIQLPLRCSVKTSSPGARMVGRWQACNRLHR